MFKYCLFRPNPTAVSFLDLSYYPSYCEGQYAEKYLFILFLFAALLLKNTILFQDEKALMTEDPFAPLLTEFLENKKYHCCAFVAQVSWIFLRMDLLSVPLCEKRLGLYILKLLTYAGAASNSINDIIQS